MSEEFVSKEMLWDYVCANILGLHINLLKYVLYSDAGVCLKNTCNALATHRALNIAFSAVSCRAALIL